MSENKKYSLLWLLYAAAILVVSSLTGHEHEALFGTCVVLSTIYNLWDDLVDQIRRGG